MHAATIHCILVLKGSTAWEVLKARCQESAQLGITRIKNHQHNVSPAQKEWYVHSQEWVIQLCVQKDLSVITTSWTLQLVNVHVANSVWKVFKILTCSPPLIQTRTQAWSVFKGLIAEEVLRQALYFMIRIQALQVHVSKGLCVTKVHRQ
jgi:hypothetical protein